MSSHVAVRPEMGPSASEVEVGTGPILVWMDDIYESSEALGWAARLAKACSTPLIAARSWSPHLGEFRAEAHRCALDRRREEMAEWCLTARDQGVEPSVEVIEGIGAADVVADANRRQAMMVVRGIGLPGHHHIGGEAESRQLLHETCLPVALVPVAGATRPMRRIMVALDGDDLACPGVQRWVDRLLATCAEEVHLADVLPYQAEWVPASDPRSIWSTSDEALHRSWHRLFDRAPGRAEVHVVEAADPVGAWTSVAHRMHADLVIAPVHAGRGPFHQRRSSRLVRLVREIGVTVLAVAA